MQRFIVVLLRLLDELERQLGHYLLVKGLLLEDRNHFLSVLLLLACSEVLNTLFLELCGVSAEELRCMSPNYALKLDEAVGKKLAGTPTRLRLEEGPLAVQIFIQGVPVKSATTAT